MQIVDARGLGPLLALACYLRSQCSSVSPQQQESSLQLLLVACLGVLVNVAEEATPSLQSELARSPMPEGDCLDWLCSCAVRT